MRGLLVPVVVALLAGAPPAAADGAAADRAAHADLRLYDRAKDQVKQHGWWCVPVRGARGERGFAYSMGLSGKHLPELGIFGTDDPATACAAIDRVARALVAAGRFPRNGAEVFRNGEGRVVLRAVLRNEFFDRCTFAKRWRDEHHVADARAMQILVLDPGEPLPR